MIRAIIAFLASVLTVVQAFSILIQGQTICFNTSCAIVDNLTTVSPLYFNIAGFLFFQALFWCFLWGRDGSENWHKLARLLLLAGLCAEAVLIFFQYSIATVFCSYCLVVFAFIVVLTVLSGLRQILYGVVLFSAVTIACFGLQFREGAGSGASLDSGSIAMLTGQQKEAKIYLFFSSTCVHCENVIEALKQDNNCTIRFNPVERLEAFDFPGVEHFTEYNPAVNLNFIKSLSIKEVPVLVTSDQQKTFVLKGEQQIREYLDASCREKKAVDYQGTSSIVPTEKMSVPGVESQGDDACSVDTDCVKVDSGDAAGEQ
jgi:uncharacterized membrane protein